MEGRLKRKSEDFRKLTRTTHIEDKDNKKKHRKDHR